MSRSAAPALAVSHGLLRALVALNLLAGLFILTLLVLSLVAAPFFVKAMGIAPGTLLLGGRLIMLFGLASIPLMHRLLTRLLAIVGTVGAGDPFVPLNAQRLRTCAWALLGLELLHLAVGAASAAGQIDVDWDFTPTGLLAVLLLFVLAQVFAQGARMRDDLEGTV
ncbi:DUF2975 domain-containing protein [Sphingomonas sp. LB-2]|uniref:DUF2975 domain-containing protein n=1 Tax=Sphingomonas caeni TaxID=2984949 RepID=UPI00222F1C12|nr:DUF2975 domain-containing protein [Sphingomonas caeni]MCW3848486.1 DUF2975 domain-containing protein [Sphingomonas caeni]